VKSRSLILDRPLDLVMTLAPVCHGPGDPTVRRDGPDRVLKATRTPEGLATLEIAHAGAEVRLRGWGPGASWALEHAPELLGEDDDPSDFVAHHPRIRDSQRRNPGFRMCRSRTVVEALIPTVIAQKITSVEAYRSYRKLVLRYGEPAPGPGDLHLSPAPKLLASLPYYELHRFGIEKRRADVLRKVCARAGRMQEAAAMTPPDAMRRLQALPGVGAWTAAFVVQVVLGDPDAVVTGDYNLPNVVAWVLAGEPRADDRRMLELLEPYRGQRARATRLIKATGMRPPRFGPRHRLRNLAQI
jgi:3-methyladenine DNA glycosylase/8-oxoguanine DNA glycosylase